MGLLRTRRGLALLGFATVMALACVLLGLWQLDRYQQRADRNDAVRTALATDPVALDSLLPDAATPDEVPDDVEWRSVEVSGVFDASRELLLRLRPVEGQNGLHALAPLVLADGRTVLVDRGFLPTASQSTDAVAAPGAASGPVELVGRVRLSEEGQGAGLDSDTAPPTIRFVDLGDLQQVWQDPLVPVWLERIEQVPAEDSSLTPVPAPSLSSGPSLIYAVQWFLFGVIAVVGFVILARRDASDAPPGDAELASSREEDSQPA